MTANQTISRVIEALFSLQFLFLAVTGALLLREKLSETRFNRILFLTAFAYLFLFHGKFLHVFSMAGDNICQIAYWKILFHPNLAGSIGASYTKPGQMLILGPLYELSRIFGENVFRIGLCLVMAGCVWILARIATDIGGREAGVAALPISIVAFQSEFLAGSYSIFLVPTIFAGLRLYHHPHRQAWGRMFLALSIQFHIQSAPILAVIWLELLRERRWRELWRFTMAGGISLALWLFIILRVQGSFTRISSSGPAVGYIGSYGDSFAYRNTTEYLFKAIWSELSESYTYTFLFILITIGIIGIWRGGHGYYLAIFSIPLLLVANVLFLNGTLNISRYFAVFYGFGCSAGIGSLVMFARNRSPLMPRLARTPFAGLTVLLVLIAAATTVSSLQFRQPNVPAYVISAHNLLADPFLPAHSRLMTEDDLLYPVVAETTSRFAALAALQRFNTAPPPSRTAMLGNTDYIWIALTGEHQYYYLDYLAIPSWREDPFRRLIAEIITTGTRRSLYGFRFDPVDMNRERLLLRVERELPPAQ